MVLLFEFIDEKEDAAIESDFKPLEDTTNRQMDIPVIQDVTKQHSTESAENPEVDSHAKRREHLGLTIETKKRAAKAEIIQADSPKEEKPSFGLTIKLQRVASGSPGSDGSPPANAKRDNFRENLAVSTKSRFSPEKSEDQSQQVQQLTPLKFPEESKNPTTPLTSSPTRSPSGRKIKLEDFTMVGPIGRGAYGEVVLVKKKINGQLYAMKVIDKLFLKKVCYHETNKLYLLSGNLIGKERAASLCRKGSPPEAQSSERSEAILFFSG